MDQFNFIFLYCYIIDIKKLQNLKTLQQLFMPIDFISPSWFLVEWIPGTVVFYCRCQYLELNGLSSLNAIKIFVCLYWGLLFNYLAY